MSEYAAALREAAAFIREHDHFLVISHVSPDGDTTGSALAVSLLLEQEGKTYTVANEGETPAKFSFLPRFERLVNLSQQPPGQPFACVISVDAADSKRMGDVRQWFAPDALILNIDHHPTNDCFGSVNVIRTDAAATAEIVFDLVKEGNFRLDEEIATCLYTGLLTDTGGFRYSNTSPRVMTIAAELLQYGVKPGEIAHRCLEAITPEHVQILRRALQTLVMTHENLVASMKVTYNDLVESRATPEDLSGLVNYGRNIEGVEVGLLFTETEPGLIKVSLRSRQEVDVSRIAKSFGGGGHARAAGFTWRGSLEEVEEKLLGAVAEVLPRRREVS